MILHIPGQDPIMVLVLARALQALAKIGDELYVEPHSNGISFRSVNSARSAYATFNFSKSFFSFYKSENDAEHDEIKCKISMKSCTPLFRSPANFDKHVETCLIRLEQDGSQLVFEFKCRFGIVKTHYMPIIECETLQAQYPKDDVPNKLKIEAKALGDAILNFQQYQSEITLIATSRKALLKTYNDETTDQSKLIHTEFCLEYGEFEEYIVGCETDITFCLREFKALLSFAESVDLPVSIHFKLTGQPVVFLLNNAEAFEAHFVLATLSADTNSDGSCSESTPNTLKKNNTKDQRKIDNENSCSEDLVSQTKPNQDNGFNNSAAVEQLKVTETNISTACVEDEALHAFFDGSEPVEGESFIGPNTERNKRPSQDFETDEIVPMSPQQPSKKKARLVFKRCFDATFNPKDLQGHDEVLAEDSGGDSD